MRRVILLLTVVGITLLASGPASWAQAPGSTSEALFEISHSPDRDINTASIYTKGSFKVKNNSPDGQKIAKLRVNVGPAVLPDLVFDPAGTAGDNVGKCFTADSGTTQVGLISPTDPCSDPFSDPHDGGYRVLTLNFTDFGPGETFTFSVDGDPTSINGANDPGPNGTGKVSGLELTGTEATVEFDDGSSHTAETFRTPDSPHSSKNILKGEPPEKPGIDVLGITAPVKVTEPEQTVRVSGPAGSNVSLLVLEAGLFTQGVPNGGHDLDPYEANNALAVTEKSAQLGSEGTVDIPVTLTRSDPDGGLNYLVAVVKDASGRSGPNSDTLVLELAEDDTEDPDAPTINLTTESGACSADCVTDDVTPTFEGTSEAGSEVRVFDGTTLLGEAPADSTTAYSFTVPDGKALTEGEHQITAKAVDAAGNVSVKSDALTVTVETTAPADNTAPTGTVLINDGAARTRSRSVTLSLSATDPSPGSGVTEMRISKSEAGLSSASWEPYVTSKQWKFGRRGKTKTVYIQYRDAAGNISAVATDSIWYKR
jgi:hypothetical protein